MNKTERGMLTALAQSIPKHGTIVELGSYLGISARAIARGIKKSHSRSNLFCVDTWKGVWKTVEEARMGGEREMAEMLLSGNARAQFEANMETIPHTTLEMFTKEAVSLFGDGTVHMVFIDADHSYDAVREDILLWKAKLVPNGILCGHDYGAYEGVTRAVDELIPRFTVVGTIWVRECPWTKRKKPR